MLFIVLTSAGENCNKTENHIKVKLYISLFLKINDKYNKHNVFIRLFIYIVLAWLAKYPLIAN